MKSLKARVNAGIGMRVVTGITLLMSSALGQAQPDRDTAFVPEPSILTLWGAGILAVILVRLLKK